IKARILVYALPPMRPALSRLTSTLVAVFVLLLAVSDVRADPSPGNWAEIGGDIRNGHSIVYDPVGNRLISFGGIAHGLLRNDVMVLDLSGPSHWTPLAVAVAAPAPRWGQAACYDPVRGRMIVTAGQIASNLGTTQFAQDTWALHLANPPSW